MKQIAVSKNLKILEEFKERIPIRIACITKYDWPVVLSMWYTVRDGKIYCATQKNAKVVSFLRENPKCAFEIAGDKPPYKGFRGKGTASIKTENAKEILDMLIRKYIPKEDSELEKLLLKNIENEVIIEINPMKLSKWDYSNRMKNSL